MSTSQDVISTKQTTKSNRTRSGPPLGEPDTHQSMAEPPAFDAGRARQIVALCEDPPPPTYSPQEPGLRAAFAVRHRALFASDRAAWSFYGSCRQRYYEWKPSVEPQQSDQELASLEQSVQATPIYVYVGDAHRGLDVTGGIPLDNDVAEVTLRHLDLPCELAATAATCKSLALLVGRLLRDRGSSGVWRSFCSDTLHAAVFADVNDYCALYFKLRGLTVPQKGRLTLDSMQFYVCLMCFAVAVVSLETDNTCVSSSRERSWQAGGCAMLPGEGVLYRSHGGLSCSFASTSPLSSATGDEIGRLLTKYIYLDNYRLIKMET